MSHYLLARIDMAEGRSELHELLHLTGAEISCNTLPAGVSIPFVHAHTENEEIYLVLDGSGWLYVDGEEVAIRQGDIPLYRQAPGRFAGAVAPDSAACGQPTTVRCAMCASRFERAASATSRSPMPSCCRMARSPAGYRLTICPVHLMRVRRGERLLFPPYFYASRRRR